MDDIFSLRPPRRTETTIRPPNYWLYVLAEK